MSEKQRVLLLGGTGRTGKHVLSQLLERGVEVRAIVRSAQRLPEGTTSRAGMTLVEADLLSLSQMELLEQVRGCDAIVSCLGHNTDLKGIFGPPHNLVTSATQRMCNVVAELRPATPVRFVLMSSVSVNRPNHLDTRRSVFERAVLGLLRALVPPARDNQNSADFLSGQIGQTDPFLQWVVVRPDTLVDGEVSKYALHEDLVSSLAKPDLTAMANVAHFMCDLATEPPVWDAWKGKLPVIVNEGPERRSHVVGDA
jgi:hypothetical protein